jgi:cutinase
MAKLFSLLTLIVAAAATPVIVATRQLVFDRTSLTENEFSSIFGGCKDVIFVWARGSTELGNMVGNLR